ncbi:hypothetical protein G6F36_012928 [Rhizopus arrhizus]|nr:hypothetical protein G6F36_012928 [Rhizopus arrhizus]
MTTISITNRSRKIAEIKFDPLDSAIDHIFKDGPTVPLVRLRLSSLPFLKEDTLNPVIATEQSLEEILSVAAELPTEKVDCLGVLDLGSDTVVSMLQEYLSQEYYSEIIEYAVLLNIELTAYTQELITTLCLSKLVTVFIKSILYQVGFKQSFNLILNHDASFIETTVRHLLDLMDSPNNPLNKTMTWLQLDGLRAIDNKKMSPVLIDFSDGTKVNNTINKESSDINKLYLNMMNVIAGLPANVFKKTFCACFYDDKIYFEELFIHKQKYYRKTHTSFRCPTTPRLLIEYIKQIVKILQWKEAIVNLTLEFEE